MYSCTCLHAQRKYIIFSNFYHPWNFYIVVAQIFLRRFRDLIRVPSIPNRVPKIRENCVPRIREIGSLQIHIGYLTFSLKKPCSSDLPFFTFMFNPTASSSALLRQRSFRTLPYFCKSFENITQSRRTVVQAKNLASQEQKRPSALRITTKKNRSRQTALLIRLWLWASKTTQTFICVSFHRYTNSLRLK